MRAVMASFAVAAVLAVACLVAVTADQEQELRDYVVVNRHFPSDTHFPRETGILARVRKHEEIHRVEEDGQRMQWKFNPWNPFQTFGVRRQGHMHRKCGMAAKLGSWWSTMFGHHRGHEEHHHHRHHHEEELRREHDHHHRFMGDMEHHRYFGWGLLRNIGRWFSGIPSFLSDVPTLIRNWSARVGGRKPPTVESVTEPLDMHALQKPSSPSLSCTLREKLSRVFTAVAEEVVATTGSAVKDDTESDVMKRNLKKFMGDSMQLRIVKNICDTSSMSPCEQEFCDVFLSHPKSGVLMAFRVLGLNPVRAAINPKGVAAGLSSSRPLVRPVLSTNERDMIVNLRKTHRLAHIVFQRILAANPTEESVPDFKHKLKNIFSKISGGELNPCKACLRQEIFRFKKLAKKSMIEVCENPVDSHLEQSCRFAKENRFVFKTLFAYKFKLWERASLVCRSRKACDSPFTSYELASSTLVKEKETPNLHFAHFDVNHFRNPRGVEVAPFMTSPMHGKGLNCRQRALHRAAMLRGHSLDAIASELLKADGLSSQREQGPIIVVEFMTGPQMEIGQEIHSIPLSLGASSLQKWDFFHSSMNIEPGTVQNFEQRFAGSVEMEPLREFLKKPLVDSSPVHLNDVIEDAIAKPHDMSALTSTSADVPLELPSSVESNAEHPDM
ncbi:hypothetical protein KC19_12G165100 [Ceratodon purpureus]|uniref:Uncharacterized protein n=2 Tax=Ceratodon purpureus TaxID=3225 RepID=A0A8T0GAH8_CERPU|nr:hypothetical protein KC19_12G165100 [Ceratodon purpureus]